MHHLLRQGADEFVPYPLPEGELSSAIDRMRNAAQEAAKAAPGSSAMASASRRSRADQSFPASFFKMSRAAIRALRHHGSIARSRSSPLPFGSLTLAELNPCAARFQPITDYW